jgi:diguanylate cyclase (GGDEF)-like protein
VQDSTTTIVAKVRDFMSIPKNNPELLKAQCEALTKQIPLLYFILLTNTWILAYNFIGKAPAWLTIYCPIAMTFGCAIRILRWWRNNSLIVTTQQAVRILTRTNRLSSFISIGFTAWAIALFPYGDIATRCHVAFYMAITVIGCIFCLMHLRSAAFMVAAIVNTAFVAFFLSSGSVTFIAMAINVALTTGAMLIILLVYYHDFTEMVRAKSEALALSDENLRLASLDALTQLPNRRRFFEALDTALDAAEKNSTRLAVGVLDLDGFKPVNDLHGHVIGDELLVEVGRKLLALCSDTVRLFRLGGDEFAVLIIDAADNQALLGLGNLLCSTVRQPVVIDTLQVQVSGTIGIAVYPDLAQDSVGLYERADYALYQSKQINRGHALLFSQEHREEMQADARIEQALHAADLENELSVVFQPIVDIEAERTIGFEALARWANPTLGSVSPRKFIPIAERSDTIHRITRVLLEKAFCAARTWPLDVRLSFNLSARDLNSADSIVRLIGIIHASGVDPKRVDFEITETAMVHDFEQARRAIDMLKLLGCGLSLDDFGTGFSSLSQLHALPLTKIKIDRSFVTNLHREPASYKIVKSLVALSRDMGLDCIIEGVETEDEINVLRQFSNLAVQGYYYSPPVPAAEAASFFDQQLLKTKGKRGAS